MQNTPTLTTPVLGAATATSINKVVLTAVATGSTITMTDGTTLSVTATSSIAGTAIISAGSVAFAGDQSMGSHKLTSLSAGTVATDAVNANQAKIVFCFGNSAAGSYANGTYNLSAWTSTSQAPASPVEPVIIVPAGTIIAMYVYVSANSIGGSAGQKTYVFSLRKDGASPGTNMSVTLDGTTGTTVQSSTTNPIIYTAGQRLAIQMVAGGSVGTPGSITGLTVTVVMSAATA